jgi:hypothetical protein
MQILSDPRLSAMILCLAVSVFSITLNGHLRRNFGEAVFGFLGLLWLAATVAIFMVFGWKMGLLCVAGSYVLGLVISPVSGMIAGFLRGDLTGE